mmetsp:Transcript_51637/g.166076  ORF Transcript_51637/g.166076 Transcript_51637/m.166076 type:complete len:289 (+) Transcript_51637:810-1676(+)
MVLVDDLLTDTLALCISDCFDASFSHPFIGLQTISVSDSLKPIPKRWVEDVEILDEGFGAEDLDVLGEGPTTCWTLEESKKKLRDALARLDLREDLVQHQDMHKMGKHELATEKRRVKQELKRYDTEFRRQFMRLPTHTEKEPMRPLYVYYRRLKTMISQADQGRARRGSGTAANAGSDDDGPGLRLGPRESFASIPDNEDNPGAMGVSSLRDQVTSLEARINSLQSEKAAVRARLQAFQEKFVSENNRKIRFHKDILPIERQYRMYKNLKEEIMRTEQQLRDLRAGA